MLKNATDDPDNFFGVLLQKDYDNQAAALGFVSYSYTTQFAAAYSGEAGGAGGAGGAGDSEEA